VLRRKHFWLIYFVMFYLFNIFFIRNNNTLISLYSPSEKVYIGGSKVVWRSSRAYFFLGCGGRTAVAFKSVGGGDFFPPPGARVVGNIL